VVVNATNSESGFTVPFVGLKGDYQSIRIITIAFLG